MAPKSRTSSNNRAGAPFKQAKLSFASTKPGATSSKKKKQTPKDEIIDISSQEAEADEIEDVPVPQPAAVIKREKLDVEDKAKQYKEYWKHARGRMGGQKPIYEKEEPKVYQMLRVFDLSYEYGPCIGMTRLERWERAHAMGLDPPPEVREILLTEEGVKQTKVAESVYYEPPLRPLDVRSP